MWRGAFPLLVFLSVATAARGGIGTMDGAPAGFEHLATPRQTAVTVTYGGDVIGVFPAHFSPGTVQFDRPADLVAKLPQVMHPDTVTATLAANLPGHADLLCTAKIVENCGALHPAVAGVIFDETRLQAELFVNPDQLAVTATGDDRYLPLPKRVLASVMAFSGAVAGTDSDAPNYALGNESIQSYGEMKVTTQSTIANNGLRFDTAAASIDRRGMNATGGLFRSRAMQLLSDRDIAGVSVSTSRKTVVDRNKSEGNDIILYLPRRAFVSLYREGRLYASRNYEAGNQTIDTGELPEGAYQVTLRIQEADGPVREERRFFVKSQDIPAKGHPVYYAQAGVARQTARDDGALPQLTGDPVLRLGTSRRLTDSLGVTVNGLGVADRGFVELGAFMMRGEARITATVLGSSRGDAGAQFGYQQNFANMNIAMDARQFRASHAPIPAFADMSQNLTQFSVLAATMVAGDVSLGLRGNYVRQDLLPTTLSVGPTVEWRAWQRGESMLMVAANVARTQDQNQAGMFVTFTRRFGRFGLSSTASVDTGRLGTGPGDTLHVWHDNQQIDNNLVLGGNVTANAKQQSVGGEADWRNRMGQVHGGIQQSAGDMGSHTGYGGNFSFNAAIANDAVMVGGSQNEKSAVVVHVTGDATDTSMRVLVNGAPRTSVNVGGKQVLYLAPFHTYKIRVVPERRGMIDYDTGDRRVTLYPGNVVTLDWAVNRFTVIVAHIVGEAGQPLGDAVLQDGTGQIATNAKGVLQAELVMPDSLTFTHGDQLCRVTLPVQARPANGVVTYAEPLPCIMLAN